MAVCRRNDVAIRPRRSVADVSRWSAHDARLCGTGNDGDVFRLQLFVRRSHLRRAGSQLLVYEYQLQRRSGHQNSGASGRLFGHVKRASRRHAGIVFAHRTACPDKQRDVYGNGRHIGRTSDVGQSNRLVRRAIVCRRMRSQSSLHSEHGCGIDEQRAMHHERRHECVSFGLERDEDRGIPKRRGYSRMRRLRVRREYGDVFGGYRLGVRRAELRGVERADSIRQRVYGGANAIRSRARERRRNGGLVRFGKLRQWESPRRRQCDQSRDALLSLTKYFRRPKETVCPREGQTMVELEGNLPGGMRSPTSIT